MEFSIFGKKILSIKNIRNITISDLIINNETQSKESVTSITAMQYAAVYACIKIISETIASLPIQILEKNNDKIKVRTNGNELYLINKRPNNLMSKFVFVETMVLHMLTTGNGYARIIRNKGDEPVRLDILNPNKVTAEINESNQKLYYKIEGLKNRVSSINILHFCGMSLDGINGMSPIEYHKETIGTGLASKKFEGGMYGNGAMMSGIITMPGTLTDKARERLAKSWKKAYSGSGNSGKTAILEGGVDYKAITMKPADAEFLQISKANIREIARIYRVPLHLLQDIERSTHSNIEAQGIDFVQHTIRPNLKRLEAEYDFKLLKESEKKEGNVYVKFNIEALLRGDIKTRAMKYRALFNTGALSPNDIRRLENLNSIEGGDKYYVQSGMIPIDLQQEKIENEIKKQE